MFHEEISVRNSYTCMQHVSGWKVESTAQNHALDGDYHFYYFFSKWETISRKFLSLYAIWITATTSSIVGKSWARMSSPSIKRILIDRRIGWPAFGRAITGSSIFAADAGTLMVSQYPIYMTVNACEEIALRKQSWRTSIISLSKLSFLSDSFYASYEGSYMYNWAYKGVLPSTESRGSWKWQRKSWIWNALSPSLLLLALRSSAETMSHPKEVKAKPALYWRRLFLKWQPWVSVRSSKSFKYSGGSGKSCSWTDPCLQQDSQVELLKDDVSCFSSIQCKAWQWGHSLSMRPRSKGRRRESCGI